MFFLFDEDTPSTTRLTGFWFPYKVYKNIEEEDGVLWASIGFRVKLYWHYRTTLVNKSFIWLVVFIKKQFLVVWCWNSVNRYVLWKFLNFLYYFHNIHVISIKVLRKIVSIFHLWINDKCFWTKAHFILLFKHR